MGMALVLAVVLAGGQPIRGLIARNGANLSLLRVATAGTQPSMVVQKWMTNLYKTKNVGASWFLCNKGDSRSAAADSVIVAAVKGEESSLTHTVLPRYHLAQLYYYAGEPSCALSELIPLIASAPSSMQPQVKAMTLWAAVQAGRAHLVAGDPRNAEVALKTALEIRPDNLFALFYMYRAQVANQKHAAEQILYGLRRYHLDDSEPLLAYLGETISGLIDAGVWTPTDGRKLLLWLVWQTPGNNAVRDALSLLVDTYPAQEDWKRLSAEYEERVKGTTTTTKSMPPEFSLSGCQSPSLPGGTIGGHTVRLGPNLLPNGDVEQLSGPVPVHWTFALGRTEPEDRHAWYAGGIDRLISRSGNSLRIKNVWQDPDQKGSPFYAEYRADPIPLAPNSSYVISFDYKASPSRESGVSFLLADSLVDSTPLVFAQGNLSADGTWQRSCVLFASDHDPRDVFLLIRNQELEDLWIDNVVIAELNHE